MLLAIITRPRRFPEWAAALIGAGAMTACGIVDLRDAGSVLKQNAGVFAFFLGMMAITSLAENAKVFDRLAEVAARLAGGSSRRLYLNVFILGTIISTFLTNDATALILTPIVYALVTRLRLDPLPFAFACTFIADTASMTLPMSNPINVVLTQHFDGLTLDRFLRYVALPSVAAIAINIAVFLWLFRRSLGATFEPLPDTATSSPSERRAMRWAAICLLAVALAFLAASAVAPGAIGAIAVAGAMGLVLVTAAQGRLHWQELSRGISWGIFPFIAGMFLMVRGIEHQGVTTQLATLVQRLAGTGTFQPAIVSTFFAAAGSNLINNVPMVAVMTATIPTIQGASPHALVFGTLIGCDLGPNLTVVGSLSTMIWLLLLRQRGMDVSALDYARLGLIVTPIMLLASSVLLGILTT